MNTAEFFSVYRASYGKLSQSQVGGLTYLLGKLETDPPDSREHAAYMLATVKHECADTYLPIREAPNKTDAWRKANFRYGFWYGRGYVQLTHKTNYRQAGKHLGLDLLTDPDRVLDPEVSYKILLRGMREGWFTGKRLADYISDGAVDYVGARRIINGTDKAATVASYARVLERALSAAKYLEPSRAPA